ncbi:MAG TPA: hypothetical protein VIJ88_03130 [Candidatus Paceibacterota bacterium]
MKEPFVTGLPDKTPVRHGSASVDEAIEKLRVSIVRRKRKRLEHYFSSPATAETRRITKRIVGESEDAA